MGSRRKQRRRYMLELRDVQKLYLFAANCKITLKEAATLLPILAKKNRLDSLEMRPIEEQATMLLNGFAVSWQQVSANMAIEYRIADGQFLRPDTDLYVESNYKYNYKSKCQCSQYS